MALGDLHTRRTWDELRLELRDELHKWGVLGSVLYTKGESQEKREVVLRLTIGANQKDIRCCRFSGEARGSERNLAAIIQAIHANRLAQQRGISDVFAQVATLLALPDPNDPYHVLGITKGLSKEAARSAYNKAVLKAHPDHGGSREEFERVQKAASSLGVL